jgi:molecular chaperone Hsp33
VSEAARTHSLSRTAADALGRVLIAASLMGLTLKDDDDLLTVRVSGNGALGGLIASCRADGYVKGYAVNPGAEVPALAGGTTDMAGAIGSGTLTVTKDLGLKEPYVSSVPLVSGEIGEDVANYFLVSEQTPTAVCVGVALDSGRMRGESTQVTAAGGFLIQATPGAPEPIAAFVESAVVSMPPITKLLAEGLTPEGVLTAAFGGLDVEFTARAPVGYRCDCGEERVANALASLPIRDLRKMRDEDGGAEIKCHFCNKTYSFGKPALEELIRERMAAFLEGLRSNEREK